MERYQLHPVYGTTQYPIGSTNAHNQKKEKKTKRRKKSRYGIPTLAATVHPPARQHLNCRLSKSNASKKGTVHKRHRLPIERS
jgi:hypothetical protein